MTRKRKFPIFKIGGRIEETREPSVLDDALAAHPWSFALTRELLAEKAELRPRPGYPHRYALPADCLRPVWHSHEKDDSAWVELSQSYVPAPGGWRILLNGRDVAHTDGFGARLRPDDVVSIFPPGR